MTSLRDRPNTALLVVDVQNNVVANTYQRDEVIATISDLIGKRIAGPGGLGAAHERRDAGGSDAWQSVPELQRRTEPLVHKKYGDAFEDTDLESERLGGCGPARR